MRLVSRRGELHSMSGHPLSWSSRVRIAYLDEAGVGEMRAEPYMVIAGVILNGDQDWQPIQRHLQSILRRNVPDVGRKSLIFHAKDIWHGSKHFPREKFPLELRQKIFMEIAEIPKRFHISIVVGCLHRISTMENIKRAIPGISQERIDILTHAEVYIHALAEIDTWMSRNAPNEVVMVIAEDRPGVKAALNLLHDGATHDDDAYWIDQGADVFYTRHIIDTVHLTDKEGSPMLQIADMCAFIIRRHLSDKPDIASAFALLEPQLASPPRDGVWTLPSERLPRNIRVNVPLRSVRLVQ
jgi:hypothetical protein